METWNVVHGKSLISLNRDRTVPGRLLEDYAELVDCTDRAILDGKKGAIPDEMLPLA